jgi:hypothetical protein
LLLKKLKGLICYLKNLKDQSVTNIKLKGPMDAFCLILPSPLEDEKIESNTSLYKDKYTTYFC